MAYGILVPQPGIEPVRPAVGMWSLNHWTTREVPCFYLLLIPSGILAFIHQRGNYNRDPKEVGREISVRYYQQSALLREGTQPKVARVCKFLLSGLALLPPLLVRNVCLVVSSCCDDPGFKLASLVNDIA